MVCALQIRSFTMHTEASSAHRTIAHAVLAPEYLEVSEHEPPTQLAGKREPKATPASLRVAQVVETRSASRSKSRPVEARSASRSKSQPVAQPQLPGMIDPLAVPVPPELGPTIYSWIRRLALQADLPTADRVLRDALTEISGSLSVTIVYPGQDGLWSLGGDNEIPREVAPIVAVAQARRAVIASHTALIPIVTTTETVAVVLLARNPRNPAFQPVEQLAMLGLSRESAAILHHLVVQHMQKATEADADKGSLYRHEALEAHRGKSTEGAPIHISPVWVRRAYPLLVATVVLAAVFSIFIRVPTYSSGPGVVILEGTTITAPAMGTVDQVLVSPGQAVNKGTILVKLQAAAEQDELTSAKADLDNWTRAYISEQSDDTIKKQLANAYTHYNTARSKLEQRTIRALKAGTVTDIRTRGGSLLNPGDQICTIVDADKTEPEIFAFLPVKDRPRLRPGMKLQVEIVGYTKIRELATITFVSREGMGSNEAAKILGQTLADAVRLPQNGSYVLVKAKLPGRTFKTDHYTLFYSHGMQAVTEVLIAEKPFLVTLFPALEKYIPD